MNNNLHIIATSLALLTLVLPFLGLSVFFEKRKAKEYQFRSWRFLAFIAIIVFINIIVLPFIYISSNDNIFDNAKKEAEITVVKGRASQEFAANNWRVMFPSAVDSKSESCYRAAMSNYIEDKWKESFHEQSCKHYYCADDEVAMYKVITESPNFGNDINGEMKALLGTVWGTAKDVYPWSMPASNKRSGQDLEKYNQYFANCSSLKLPAWAEVGDDLLTPQARTMYRTVSLAVVSELFAQKSNASDASVKINIDKVINDAKESQKRCIPYVIMAIAFIIFIFGVTRTYLWESFASVHKWMSRTTIFILLLCVGLSLGLARNLVVMWMPVHLSSEIQGAILTASAIKMGLLSSNLQNELISKLPDGGEKLVSCVWNVSNLDIKARQDKCGDDRACIEAVPTMTRAEILEKIKESQASSVEKTSEPCKGVDVSKL